MKFKVYQYTIKDENGREITGMFTLKANAKHPEIVQELDAELIQIFEADQYRA